MKMRKPLILGVNLIGDAVATTFGPNGKKCSNKKIKVVFISQKMELQLQDMLLMITQQL